MAKRRKTQDSVKEAEPESLGVVWYGIKEKKRASNHSLYTVSECLIVEQAA